MAEIGLIVFKNVFLPGPVPNCPGKIIPLRRLFLLLLIFFRRFVRNGTRFRIWAICVPRIAHFLRRFEEVWHTISNLGNLCANIFSFYFGDRGGVAHDLQFRRFVCHEIFIFSFYNIRRHSRAGTQNPNLPICVPKLTAADLRDRAGLAHKPRKSRFVCQN